MMRNRIRVSYFCRLAAILAVLVSALPFAVYGADATKPAAKAPAGKLCPSSPPCGSHCSNYPYRPTDCWTTQHGPAKADVIDSPTNLLYCNNNTYALCFFSGPPNPTGKNPSTNNPLPCVLSKDGKSANCTCQAYTSGANFVDINGILNRGAYFETVSLCGPDGAKCQNIVNCGKDGTKSGCQDHPQAPVCKYVKDQNPKDPKVSLMPKADLISTFSFAMDSNYSQTPPTSCSKGIYLGCMTAPCKYGPNHKSPTTDGELVQCQCPAYDGVYQVGQPDQTCKIPSSGGKHYAWSASNLVKPGGGE